MSNAIPVNTSPIAKSVTAAVEKRATEARAAEQAIQERLSREGPLAKRRQRRGVMSLLSAERMDETGLGSTSKLGGE